MTLTLLPQVLTSILLTLVSLISVGQTQQKDILLGKWTFDKFYFTGGLSDVPDAEQKKANSENNGLVITFLTNNKYQATQKNGLKANNVAGTYKVLPHSKLIIMGDTANIIQLDKNYLKLYSDSDRPTIAFKRLQ